MPDLSTIFLQGVVGFLATFGFSVLFNAPRHTIISAGLVGAGGHILRYVLRGAGVSNEVATFAGALFVGLVGYWTAVRFNLPRLVFTVTGIISMVPGIAAYEVLVFFSRGDVSGGLQSGVRAILATGAIAAGLSLARFLTDPETAKIADAPGHRRINYQRD